jgi:hypothetical protein
LSSGCIERGFDSSIEGGEVLGFEGSLHREITQVGVDRLDSISIMA